MAGAQQKLCFFPWRILSYFVAQCNNNNNNNNNDDAFYLYNTLYNTKKSQGSSQKDNGTQSELHQSRIKQSNITLKPIRIHQNKTGDLQQQGFK